MLTSGKLFPVEAEFVTTRGSFTVDLHLSEAPLAVAHFVDLAEGERLWIDTSLAIPRRFPYYNNRRVTVVEGSAGDRLGIIGGADLMGDRELGYVIPDDYGERAAECAYSLVMESNGPNANAGRVAILGGIVRTEERSHRLLLGRIIAQDDREVIDQILSADNEEVLVKEVLITQNESERTRMKEMLTGLPRVEFPVLHPRVAVEQIVFSSPQPSFSVFWSAQSDNLTIWRRAHRHYQAGNLDFSSFPPLVANGPQMFLRSALVIYPESVAPLAISTLSEQILTVTSEDLGQIRYHFDGSGESGDYEVFVSPDEPPVFVGEFSLGAEERYATPYSLTLTILAPGLGGSARQKISLGWDERQSGILRGRHRTELFGDAGQLFFADWGGAELAPN
ncbi:hypothetical protein [Roseibacillus ishigakijimensis]